MFKKWRQKRCARRGHGNGRYVAGGVCYVCLAHVGDTPDDRWQQAKKAQSAQE